MSAILLSLDLIVILYILFIIVIGLMPYLDEIARKTTDSHP